MIGAAQWIVSLEYLDVATAKIQSQASVLQLE